MSEMRMLLTLVDNGTAPSGNATNNIARFLTLLIIFILVLGVTFYTTRFVAKTQQGRTQSANMEIMETMPLAAGKYLQIVRIGSQYVVLAIGKDSITKIADLSEEEYVPGERTQLATFGDLLKKMTQKNNPSKTDIQKTDSSKKEDKND